MCNECRRKFDKTYQTLCVQHEDWRQYTSPVTKLPESKYGNAYYHVHPWCIMSKWPAFLPGELQVSEEMKSHLAPQHKELISELFGIFV